MSIFANHNYVVFFGKTILLLWIFVLLLDFNCINSYEVPIPRNIVRSSNNISRNIATTSTSSGPNNIIKSTDNVETYEEYSTRDNDHNHQQQQRYLQKKIWMYQKKHPISYEEIKLSYGELISRINNDDNENGEIRETTTTSILFLNGFGMGTFHQHRLIDQLTKRYDNDNTKNQHLQQLKTRSSSSCISMYAIDYIGQGESWPINCNDGYSINEYGLQYSGNTWMDQIIQFIEEVIIGKSSSQSKHDNEMHNSDADEDNSINKNHQHKIHIVGNSVGGHIATYIAAYRPDLIESIVLLNPTPLWGLNLPTWDGILPAPILPKFLGRILFNIIRNHKTIEQFLKATYVHEDAYTTENSNTKSDFMEQIYNCTTSNGGHAAFASILWSPPITISIDQNRYDSKMTTMSNDSNESNIKGQIEINNFYDALKYVQCDALLCFGKNDPWCKPILAKKMLQSLQTRIDPNDGSVGLTTQRYLELSDVGHCPNHEGQSSLFNNLLASIYFRKSKKKNKLTFFLSHV